VEEKDLKKVILEYLNKIIPLLSLSVLIIGGLWLFIYSYVIVKELPRVGVYFLYYISAVLIFIVFSIVLMLVFPIYLYLKDKEENAGKKYTSEEENKNINNHSKDRSIKDRLHEIFQKMFLISFLCAYFFVSCVSFVLSYIKCDFSLCKIPFLLAIVLFIIIQLSIIFFLFFILKKILKKDEQRNITFFSIIIIITVILIFFNLRFFLITSFYILKLGYFETNLTLEKEYVEKSGLKTYLEERCKIKCLDESSNDNYCRTFKLFIFLRTDSEYIVGCSENSDVRIRIPSDKVIAIEYIEENKNTPAQQQTLQQQNKQTKN
jgi:uncharacterized membrane protein